MFYRLCSTTRRSSGSVAAIVWNVGSDTSPAAPRTRGRGIATLRPWSTISLGTVPARLAVRSGWWAYRGPQITVRSSFKHRGEHAQARPDGELQQLGLRVDKQINQPAIRLGEREWLCETSFSWRLIF